MITTEYHLINYGETVDGGICLLSYYDTMIPHSISYNNSIFCLSSKRSDLKFVWNGIAATKDPPRPSLYRCTLRVPRTRAAATTFKLASKSYTCLANDNGKSPDRYFVKRYRHIHCADAKELDVSD